MCNSTWKQQAPLQTQKNNLSPVCGSITLHTLKSFISLLFLSSFGKTLSECQKLFLARQLVLIEPYGVYWRDWRERGRHFHLKAAACMVMKWGGGGAVHSYEQRVFQQQPDNAWATRLKGFGISAAFSPSTYMKGTNANTYKGNAYSWTWCSIDVS